MNSFKILCGLGSKLRFGNINKLLKTVIASLLPQKPLTITDMNQQFQLFIN